MEKKDNGIKKQKNEIVVKIMCVLISFTIWVYLSNIENPVQTIKVRNIPVKLVGIDNIEQSKLALLNNIQSAVVNLSVKGKTLTLNKITASDFEVSVDLSEYALNKDVKRLPVQIVKQPDNVVILDDDNLYIDVSLDTLVERNIPITLDLKTIAQDGYSVGNTTFSPSSVLIKGPATYVNQVEKVVANNEIRDLNKNENLALELTPVDKEGRKVQGVAVNPNIVNVNIPVQKVKTVDIKAQTIGKLPNNSTLRSIELSKAKVEIIGDEKDLENITSINTEPIDLSTITESKKISVGLKIPSNVKVSAIGNQVDATININTLSEKTLDIITNNLNKDLDIEFNSKITIKLVGLKADIDKIKPEELQAYIDLKDLKEGEHKVRVTFKKLTNVTIDDEANKTVVVTLKNKHVENQNQQTQNR